MAHHSTAVITFADAHSLYPLIAPEFNKRLPLTNLQPFVFSSSSSSSSSGSSQQQQVSSQSQQSSTISGGGGGGGGGQRTLRPIPALDVELKKFSPDLFPRAMPVNTNISPYFLHLYLVSCDDTDTYKNYVKKQIQDWLAIIQGKKNQEWLIVHVITNPDTPLKKSGGNRFLGGLAVGGSVYDKLRSDFSGSGSTSNSTSNSASNNRRSGADRCIQIKPQCVDRDQAEAWDDLFDKIREGVLFSFSMQIASFEEDTRKLDSQRLLPGWNYCQYFIMKEGLAFAYEHMTLYDESLLIYDELEAQFFQSMTEQGVPWFTTFGGAGDPLSAHADPLDLSRKPYREMILQNNVTIFDFRVYLFARMCKVLMRAGRPGEIAKRGKAFVGSFARTIREYDVSLPPYFSEMWIYSMCINLVAHCDELALNLSSTSSTSPYTNVTSQTQPVSTDDSQLSSSSPSTNTVLTPDQLQLKLYEETKADLLTLARIQLDILGVASNMVPTPSMHVSRSVLRKSAAQAASALETAAVGSSEGGGEGGMENVFKEIPNESLRMALTDRDTFDSLYLTLTSRASRSAEYSGRRRLAMALSHDIAILKYNRGDIVAAAEIWGGSSSTSPDVSSSSSSSSVGIVKILLNGGWTLAGIAAAQMLCDCYKRIAISPPESLVLPPPPLLLGGDNSQDDPSRQSTLTTTTISISGVVSRFLRCALDLLVEWNGNMAASAASTVVDDVWSLAAGKQDEANTDGGKMVLDSDFIVEGCSLFGIQVETLINKVADDEGIIILVDIDSALPKDVVVSEIAVSLMGGDESQVWFTASSVTLKPGKNIAVRLVADRIAFPGIYSPEQASIRVGDKLKFKYVLHLRDYSALVPIMGTSLLGQNIRLKKKKTFRIHELSSSLYVNANVPDTVMMNRDVDEIIIRVYARQHALRNAKMKLSSFTGLKLHHFTGSLDNSEEAAARGGNNNGSSCPSPIKYRIYTSASGGDLTSGQLLTTTRMKTSTSVASVRQEESKIDGEMQVDSEGVISLPDCEEGDNILFLVGCSPVTLKQEDAILHKIKVAIFYECSDGRRRMYSNVDKIRFSLPLLISDNIIYGQQRQGSILNFKVTSVTTSPLRLCSIQLLQKDSEAGILPLVEFKEMPLFRHQHVTYAYSLKHSTSIRQPLTFAIKYYHTSDEMESFIIRLLDQQLYKCNLQKYTGLLSFFFRKRVLSRLDYTRYAMVNNLVIDSLDIEWLNENMLASEEHNVQAEIREFLASFHNLIKEVSAENCRWKMPSKSALKTLVVCVNPPEEKIIVKADITFLDAQAVSRAVIGSLLECRIEVTVPEAIPQQFDLIAHLDTSSHQDHWLMSGKTKVRLSFTPGDEIRCKSFDVTLIPLKAGYLPYPTVLVTLADNLQASSATLPKIDVDFLQRGSQLSVLPLTESRKIIIKDATLPITVN